MKYQKWGFYNYLVNESIKQEGDFMSSNTSKGKAIKGSKYWIQEIINSNLKQDLDQKIGLGAITWLSPLKRENYVEYKLNQEVIMNKLNLNKQDFSFWPSNQPQWDAIGVVGETIILVEAKAHINELHSNMSVIAPKSKELILKSMKEVFDELACSSETDFKSWITGYYQLGNRLTFLKMLTKRYNKKLKLVLLNIVNDPTYKATSEEIWQKDTRKVFKKLRGTEEVPEDVIVVNFMV